MRIVYLSQYFPPEMGAPSARVFELSRRWVKNGTQVTVLTGFPNHPTGIIPEHYRGFRFLEEKTEGIRVVRTYIYAAANKGFLKRILSYISFMLSSVVQGTRKIGRQDVIIATSPQFFVGIAGYLISRFKRIPFIFEVRDLWPESIVQLGQLKNRFIIRFLERIELFLYRKSIHVVGVADSTVDILTARGIEKSKISIIKNGVDLNLFAGKGNQQELKKQHGFKDKFIISYIGTHGLSHALDKVLETAVLFKDRSDILFLLVGEGAEKDNLIRKKEELGLDNVIFQNQIGKHELPDYYEMSDIVLVTLRDLPLFRHVIPSKIFEIMAMARPIIISVDGESRRLVEEAAAGLFSTPEDPRQLSRHIDELYVNEPLRRELGRNGRRFVEQNFCRDALADRYLGLIRNLLNGETE